ncbi:MAG: carboxypeptidase regulatory-like domain-containing protein [Bacteroidales bacterium]|nr:carboxypeptidase regulatory-like domain-containing protein [Bacteroidales bacterium]
MKNSLIIVLIGGMSFLLPESFSQTVNISGTVKNADGDFISDAQVMLQNHPDIVTYTGANGTFVLTGNITEIFKNKAYKKCLIENGVIKVFCNNETMDIEFYSLTGVLLNKISKPGNLYGFFHYKLDNANYEAGPVVIVKVRIGNEIFCYKYLNSQNNIITEQLQEVNIHKSADATIDSIVIMHDSYKTKTIAIITYSQSLGNITMESRILNYVFPGGSVDDLKAASPTLTFGSLTIDGVLKIPSSANSIVITADELHINENITVEYPTCSPYFDAPDLTFNVDGQAYVNDIISLSGKTGKGETTTSTCNSCYGTDGGTLTINAQNITISERIDVSGGWGSYSYISSSIRCGCSGGDGGKVVLNATGSLSIGVSGADLDVQGGDGGSGSLECGDGSDGAIGYVDFESPSININEIGGDLNMLTYNAQMIDYEKLTIYGNVKYQEELEHRNSSGAWYVSFQVGVGLYTYDWLEDLYLLRLSENSTVQLSLSASNSLADLDLYLLSYDMSGIIAQSNGATSNESINTGILTAGYYFMAVSYSDDGGAYTTGYTLKLKQ